MNPVHRIDFKLEVFPGQIVENCDLDLVEGGSITLLGGYGAALPGQKGGKPGVVRNVRLLKNGVEAGRWGEDGIYRGEWPKS